MKLKFIKKKSQQKLIEYPTSIKSTHIKVYLCSTKLKVHKYFLTFQLFQCIKSPDYSI